MGGISTGLLVANWILFIFVTGYAVYLFASLVVTRIRFIQLGQKAEFDKTMKERLKAVWINAFGHKKLMKDKKAASSISCSFMVFCSCKSERLI